jgi:opacity protein-like surface antigen
MLKRFIASLALIALLASAAAASDNPHTIFIGLQLQGGTADLAVEDGTGFAPAYDHSEMGFKFEYWNLMAADYALTAAGGIGFFSEENKPGINSIPGDVTGTYSQSSWNIRLGGDRVVKVGDRAMLFFGPGIEYWTGSAKFEDIGGLIGTVESKKVKRISLSGRIGAHMMIAENWGFTLQAGHKLGHATYEEAGAKSSWWPSSMDASGGLVFKFGGN